MSEACSRLNVIKHKFNLPSQRNDEKTISKRLDAQSLICW